MLFYFCDSKDIMLETLIGYIFSIGGVLLLFGGTVLIHELGHFLTAKWFGLRIDAFAVGMGPALWQKEVNGVVYKICLLPIGGYVALPQMDITGSVFENEDSKYGRLDHVAPWKRIIIAIAGPFMNVVAAIVICTIVWAAGKQPDEGFQEPIVGNISEKAEAYKAGLRSGDRIHHVNQDEIHFWADIQIAAMLNEDLDLKVIRDNKVLYFEDVPTRAITFGKRVFRTLDAVEPYMPSEKGALIESMFKDTPADKAGLLPGDEFISLNGAPIHSAFQFRTFVAENEGAPIEISFKRGDEIQTTTLEPYFDKELNRWLIGIGIGSIYGDVHPSPARQIQYFQGQIFRTLVAFFRTSERSSAASNIGGPVMILTGMHQRLTDSIIEGLWFTALININLAIINLLPLIILDGGHIMIALFEWITGKRPHRGLITGMANVMVVFLIGLMILLVFKDSFLLRDLNASFVEEETIEVPAETSTPPAIPDETAPAP
jgi:regulator of sigma E protease